MNSDTHDPDRDRGLYGKYAIERLRDPDGKHAGCEFFVLDPRHDPHARVALDAYAESCEADYPYLATDIRALRRRSGTA